MIRNKQWQDVLDFLLSKNNLMITTHVSPDGDAIGSEIALAQFLKQKDKTVHILNVDPVPKYFTFLDSDNEIKVYNSGHKSLLEKLDGGVVVDISDWKRLENVGESLKDIGLPLLCLDHHIPTDDIGVIAISDQNASSTGELVYDFFQYAGVNWTKPLINALYTCILTDTGSFRFANTSPKTHRIAADLIEKGAEFRKVFSHIYESYSVNRSKLMGHLLANMHFELEGKLAWFVLSQDLIKMYNVKSWETEGFSELPRSIEGVQVSLMFTERPDKIKLSLRSRGTVPINDLANKFGGGGHKFASGASIKNSLPETQKLVVDEAKQYVKNYYDSLD